MSAALCANRDCRHRATFHIRRGRGACLVTGCFCVKFMEENVE